MCVADRFAVRVDDLAAVGQFAAAVLVVEIAVDKLGIFAVRHKADLLRFLFFGSVKIRLAGDVADLAFGHFAERKMRTRKLFLRQLPQENSSGPSSDSGRGKAIAIGRFVVFDTCIMAGRDLVAAEADRHLIERGELQTRIARDARNRRFARRDSSGQKARRPTSSKSFSRFRT